MKFVPFLRLCGGVFCYALAYAEKDYYIPKMNMSSLMVCSGLMIFIFGCIQKASILGSNVPWFEVVPDSSVLVQSIAMLSFGILIGSGDLLFLSGLSFPEVSPTMATCVFALIPVFEGIIGVFLESKPLKLGQLICCAVIIAGIVGYAMLEKSDR